jgi:hypothetical protein
MQVVVAEQATIVILVVPVVQAVEVTVTQQIFEKEIFVTQM